MKATDWVCVAPALKAINASTPRAKHLPESREKTGRNCTVEDTYCVIYTCYARNGCLVLYIRDLLLRSDHAVHDRQLAGIVNDYYQSRINGVISYNAI